MGNASSVDSIVKYPEITIRGEIVDITNTDDKYVVHVKTNKGLWFVYFSSLSLGEKEYELAKNELKTNLLFEMKLGLVKIESKTGMLNNYSRLWT